MRRAFPFENGTVRPVVKSLTWKAVSGTEHSFFKTNHGNDILFFRLKNRLEARVIFIGEIG